MSRFLDDEAAVSHDSEDSQREQEYEPDSDDLELDTQYAEFEEAEESEQEQRRDNASSKRQKTSNGKSRRCIEEDEDEQEQEQEQEQDDDDDDDDEASVDLDEYSHQVLDNADAEASDHSFIEQAQRSTAAATRQINWKPKPRSQHRVHFEQEPSESDPNETLAEQKQRKKKKLARESQQHDEPAPYSNDLVQLTLAPSNKAGKLLDTPRSQTQQHDKVNCSSNGNGNKSQSTGGGVKRKAANHGNARSALAPGVLHLHDEFMQGNLKWRVTYAAKPCPVLPDGSDYDLSGDLLNHLYTAEKIKNNEGTENYQVYLCSDRLPPLNVSRKYLYDRKKKINFSKELGEKLIRINNLEIKPNGVKRMWLPPPIFTKIKNSHDKSKKKDTSAESNGSNNSSSSGAKKANGKITGACGEFVKRFDTPAGEDWLFNRLKNFVDVQVTDFETLEHFNGIRDNFNHWTEAPGDGGWQRACDELGVDNMQWFLAMVSFFTDRGRSIIVERAKQLQQPRSKAKK